MSSPPTIQSLSSSTSVDSVSSSPLPSDSSSSPASGASASSSSSSASASSSSATTSSSPPPKPTNISAAMSDDAPSFGTTMNGLGLDTLVGNITGNEDEASSSTTTTTTPNEPSTAPGSTPQQQQQQSPQAQPNQSHGNASALATPAYSIRKQAIRNTSFDTPSPSTVSHQQQTSTPSFSKPLVSNTSLLPSTQVSPAPPVMTSSTSSAVSTGGAPPPYPALHLMPLNDTFVPKQISLFPPGQRVKIGRQTNAKTIPNGTNGYFDSKVLSRMHAEVWAEDGKVLIKDVKSSNGTFIDGQRLSPEAAESDVFELRTGVTVEFGIDIVSDDGKTIVHHKVAAKVFVVMSNEDAMASSREFSNWYRYAEHQPPQRRGIRQIGGGAGGLNSLSNNQQQQQQNGLSIDHFLGKLQTELQKSRDTSSHLNDMNSTLNDVQDTLSGGGGGGGASGLPPIGASASLFPRGITSNTAQQQALAHQQHTQSINQLQNQLSETQASLAGHVGKMRDLEGLLQEQEAVKREVGQLRRLMEVNASRDVSGSDADVLPRSNASKEDRGGRESPIAALLEAQEEEDDDDDDDARSIASVDTVVGRNQRLNGFARNKRSTVDATREHELQEQNARLAARLDELATELDNAVKLGQELKAQHAQAATTIKRLEAQVVGLEQKVEQQLASSKQAEQGAQSTIGEQLEQRWAGWKEAFEKGWAQERSDWQSEREKLRSVVHEWEQRRSSSSSDEEDAGEGDGGSDIGLDGSIAAGIGSLAAGAAVASGVVAANKSKKRNGNKAKRKKRGGNSALQNQEEAGSSSSNASARSTAPTSPSSTSSTLAGASSSSKIDGSRANQLATGKGAKDTNDSELANRHNDEATLKDGNRKGMSGGLAGWSSTPRGSFDAASSGDRSGGIVVSLMPSPRQLALCMLTTKPDRYSQIQQRHLTSAVVVVVGVAAAWAVSMKIKD